MECSVSSTDRTDIPPARKKQPVECEHKWIHMNSAYKYDSAGYMTRFKKIDTFFCEKCLEQRNTVKEDTSRDTPDWYWQ